ncbi:MAG: hypothetical protein ACYC0H_23915 [Solirubrobacteraceae bacterium]
MAINADDEFLPWEEREVAAAAREARAIGGRAGDENLDPAQRPLIEAGEGESEGFELAEQDLIDAAEHTDRAHDPMQDAFTAEAEGGHAIGEYGESDHEESSELRESAR